MEKCDLARNVTYNTFYRACQYYTFIVSLLSIYPLLILIFRNLLKSIFHGNIKILLIGYYSQILLSSVVNSIIFAHHLLKPFFAENDCDLIVDSYSLQLFQMLAIFAISCPMLYTIAISIERTISLIFVNCYEHHRVLIGPLLTFLIPFIELLLNYWLFKNETFEDTFVSYLMTPATSANALNIFFWTLLVLNAINFCIISAIYLVSNFMIKRRRRQSLTERYQMRELVFITQFVVCVSFIHIAFFGFYLTGILTIRTLGLAYFNSMVEYSVARGVFNTVPTYNLIIGPVSIFLLNRLSKQRTRKIESERGMAYIGHLGAINHDAAIYRYWNSIAK